MSPRVECGINRFCVVGDDFLKWVAYERRGVSQALRSLVCVCEGMSGPGVQSHGDKQGYPQQVRGWLICHDKHIIALVLATGSVRVL